MLGNADDARTALSRAIDEVADVGDVVALSLLRQSFLHVVGEPHESGEGDATALGQGWLTVVEALPTLDPVA